jgi:hypothetical protein
MDKNIFYILSACALSIGGCTSLSEGQQNLPQGPAVDQRVRYRHDVDADLRERMKGQASEINRKRNIEEFDRNEPATIPPTLRPQRLPNSPTDSTRHNIYWPIKPVIKPIPVKQKNRR